MGFQTNGSGRRNIPATDISVSAAIAPAAFTDGHIEISTITWQVITAQAGAFIDIKAEGGTDLLVRIFLDNVTNPAPLRWDAPYVFPNGKRLWATYVGPVGGAIRISGGMYFSTSESSK